MGQYTNKGLYNKYDKNHKERNKVDYYATPPGETLNILEVYNPNFDGPENYLNLMSVFLEDVNGCINDIRENKLTLLDDWEINPVRSS